MNKFGPDRIRQGYRNNKRRQKQLIDTIKTLFAKAKAWFVNLADGFLAGQRQISCSVANCA